MARKKSVASPAKKARGGTAASGAPNSSVGNTRVRSAGSRAMPGKASRGSLQRIDGEGFSPLSRFILDKLDRGVVLLDRCGGVVDANTLGQQVLSSNRGLHTRGGRFGFTDTAANQRYERWLADADGGNPGRSLVAAIRGPGTAPYRVLVTPASAHDAGCRVAFVVLLYGPDDSREISPEVLIELYGLTRAQADVARTLYAGHSVEETAVRLQLSLNTVRTHLKHVFSKCDVQSQAEMLHTLATGPRTL
jgi:DNA-binding CsgD family transcriptional regulator